MHEMNLCGQVGMQQQTGGVLAHVSLGGIGFRLHVPPRTFYSSQMEAPATSGQWHGAAAPPSTQATLYAA